MNPNFHRTAPALLILLVYSVIRLPAAEPQTSPSPSPGSPTLATNVPGKPEDAVRRAKLTRWKKIFRGIELREGSVARPRPLQVRAVRVDLREPTIDFLVTPSNGDEPKDTGGLTTSEFLEEFKCQVAINGSVFAPFVKNRGDPMDVEGLSLSRGDLYSPPNHWDALLLDANRKARIVRPPIDPRGAYNGLSGFYALLIRGTNNGTMKKTDPRTAVGVTRNGRYLILMVIDGRQPGYSEGATTAETAEWMRKLGAYDALNLDGGGSTALVMEADNGKPRLLNRPSGGTERRVANHLGIFANRLASPARWTP
jgi:hypothetical protein